MGVPGPELPQWNDLQFLTAQLALGADGIAVSNAVIQAIGCLGMRAGHTK